MPRWASRAEGFATVMEELAKNAGPLDDSPRSRGLVLISISLIRWELTGSAGPLDSR